MATSVLFAGEAELARSSTDANFPISLDVPSVTIGRGGAGGGSHAPDEYWVNEEAHLGIQRAMLLLLAEAGLATPIL